MSNGHVDLDKALGYEFEPRVFTYNERDLSLYALSIGAAADPLDSQELRFVYELHQDGFKPFPTYAVTFPFAALDQIMSIPGLQFNPMLLLHGEQFLEIKRPLPPSGALTNRGKITHIYDKGKGALVLVAFESTTAAGDLVAVNQTSLFIRGLGGFGGERGPSGATDGPPDRAPDAVHAQATQPHQALLYRLSSGDRNPLHADPDMASVAGFGRPILHGLCTFGFAVRAVLKHFADNDVDQFKHVKVRFSKHVFPGETIVTEMWQDTPTRILFRSRVQEREATVLSNAILELHEPPA